MFLLGEFERNYMELFDDSDPMPLLYVRERITKDDLIKTKRGINHE